ncbi:MAG: hypothetical protein ACSW8I_07980 [bacterium]
MKKVLLATLVAILFVSCNNGKNVTVFEIGDTREHVLNTMEKDFTFEGEHWTRAKILEEESGNCITVYNVEYKGQSYYKFRVYYDYETVRRLEIKIDKDKIGDVVELLSAKTGVTPHKTMLPVSSLGYSYKDAMVFMRDNDAIIVQDDDYGNGDIKYYIWVVSGEQREELNRYM